MCRSIISFYGRLRTNTRQGRIHQRHSIPDSIPVVRGVKCCLWRQLPDAASIETPRLRRFS